MNGFCTTDDYFAAFSATSGLGVTLATPDGTFLFANETFAKMFGGTNAEAHTGRNFTDLYPRDWADEKIALLRRVAYEDERLIVRCMWTGRQLEAEYRRIPGEDGGEPLLLVVVREGVTGNELLPGGVGIVRLDSLNFGPLSVLTPRELEVLALIGQGKSAKEIGEVLGCSPRTVERHRDSMGKKLDKHDRVGLALIAKAAGLELRDARVNHVDHVRQASSTKPTSETEAKPGLTMASPDD